MGMVACVFCGLKNHFMSSLRSPTPFGTRIFHKNRTPGSFGRLDTWKFSKLGHLQVVVGNSFLFPTIFGGYFVRNIWSMNRAQVVCYISGAMVPMASWALVLMIWGGATTNTWICGGETTHEDISHPGSQGKDWVKWKSPIKALLSM